MSRKRPGREKGSTLIIVILVTAFLLAVGVALLTVTGAGPKVSGNIRNQDEAFNAAEAGFEAAVRAIEDSLLDNSWTNVGDHVLREPAGIDLPSEALYFRRQPDEAILQALDVSYTGVIFHDQPFVRTSAGTLDPAYSYTAFLIDDEAGGGTPDPSDVLLVCIGTVRAGTRILSTSRLEILLGVDTAGTNP